MEMALNNIELISNNERMTEKKGVGLTLIVNNAKDISALGDCDDMCDGDIWEWNLIYGIGNDIY